MGNEKLMSRAKENIVLILGGSVGNFLSAFL